MKVGRWGHILRQVVCEKSHISWIWVEKKNRERESYIQYVYHVLLNISIHFNILFNHPLAIDSSFHVESHICSFYNFVSINFIFLMTFFSCMDYGNMTSLYRKKKIQKNIYFIHTHFHSIQTYTYTVLNMAFFQIVFLIVNPCIDLYISRPSLYLSLFVFCNYIYQ